MEVTHGEEFLLTSLEPFFFGQCLTFWAVSVPARVVRMTRVSTVVTTIHMSTQDGGPADLNRVHRTPLLVGSHPSILWVVSGTELSKDVRHLKGWPSHLRKPEAIPNDRVQRTVCLPNGRRGNTSIALSRSETLMTEKSLDRPNLRARLQKMCRKTMAKGMRRRPLLEPRSQSDLMANTSGACRRDRRSTIFSGEKPMGGSGGCPIFSEDL